jgi:hydroxylamine reductase
MFCYQCEQTAQGTGCTSHGVCGKDPETSAMQDLLVYACKDIARYAHRARQLGENDQEIDRFIPQALFVTVTNVNFDPADIAEYVKKAASLREKARNLYEKTAKDQGREPEQLETPVQWWEQVGNLPEMISAGEAVTIEKRVDELGVDITGLQELITYGLKGAGAYVDHARVLGQESDEVYAFFHKALDYLTRRPMDAGELTALALKTGEINLRAMELLDAANTGAYGDPEPTKVRVTPVAGKCIAVSGHDLKDLGDLLEQTQGKGINVYTHSEMLACHGYPGLKKYEHFKGNFGGAWQDQRSDFENFPGAILMTTNCLQKPKESYKDRLFTTGHTAWPGVQHINPGPDGKKDFTPVIEAALAQPGYPEDAEEAYTMTGFAHKAVLGVADQVIQAVKDGNIRHFFLIGGCDGAKPGRNYYTDLAQQVPDDCVILTLACGKYRFNKLEFGDIGGIPRLLDCGQCNDAYSAIRIAVALADAFDCGVNDLPLTMILSWFEQKAVAILLTLLHLGVENIRIGPTLPAFVSPDVLNVLVDKFGLQPITTPEADLQAALA